MLARLIAVIAPHHCVVCGTTGELICDGCIEELRASSRPACFACNKFSPFGRTCAGCRVKYPLTGVTIGAYYDEPLRKFMALVKYERAGDQARLGAKLLVPLLYADEFDVVAWVPAIPSRARQRGYNQAEVLAKAIARELGLPAKHLLGRFGGASQVGQSRISRLKQVKGQFYSTKGVNGQRVLLVDDVLTTGATMGECARVLKKAGAKSVWGAAMAKH